MGWLEHWGFKSDPCKDFPIKREDLLEFLVKTKNLNALVDEFNDIKAARRIGRITIVTGERGAGKTSLLFYMYCQLRNYSNVFPVFVDMSEYISKIDRARGYGAEYVTRYVIEAIIDQILKELKNTHAELPPELENLKEVLNERKLRDLPISEKAIDSVSKSLHKLGYRTITLLIDELDKTTNIDAVSSHFRSKQGFWQKLTTEGFFIYVSASPEWSSFLKHRDFSYLNYPNRIELQRFTPGELREMLKKRFECFGITEKYRFPLTDKALDKLTSVSRGNPRVFLQYLRKLLEVGANRSIDLIDEDLVDELYGEERLKSLEEDWRRIGRKSEVLNDHEGFIHMLAISTPFEDYNPRKALEYLVNIYKLKNKERSKYKLGVPVPTSLNIEERYLNALIRYRTAYVRQTKRNIRYIDIFEGIRLFFDEWVNSFSHTLEEFVDWYAIHHPKPPTPLPLQEHYGKILEKLQIEDAKEFLRKSFDIYFELNELKDAKEIIERTWEMLEYVMKTFLLHFGKVIPKKNKDVQEAFKNLCNKELGIFIDSLNFISSVRTTRNRVIHRGEEVDLETAKALRTLGKNAYEEILEKLSRRF